MDAEVSTHIFLTMIIEESVHNNGEDDKQAHRFADF
jgi:hypothetical protein